MKDVNCTEIVIKIPDRIYYGIENGITVNGSEASQIVLDAVKNGIVLPKGHGVLKDVDAIIAKHAMTKYDWEDYVDVEDLKNAPTIIEADEE